MAVERDLRARLLVRRRRKRAQRSRSTETQRVWKSHSAFFRWNPTSGRVKTVSMKKSYPTRLFHKMPSWVEDGSIFHIRIRCDATNTVVLSQPPAAEELLASVDFYTGSGRWFAHLFLLMPDHVHALLSFPRGEVMARVIADWKRYQSNQLGIQWQDNFFDHRIRNTAEYLEKAAYIRRNPVAKGLCETTEEWPWILGGA